MFPLHIQLHHNAMTTNILITQNMEFEHNKQMTAYQALESCVAEDITHCISHFSGKGGTVPAATTRSAKFLYNTHTQGNKVQTNINVAL